MKSIKNQNKESKESSTYALTEDKLNSSSNELLEITEVENTPFTVISYKEEKPTHVVMLGKYRLSEKMDEKDEAIEDAKRTDWERIMQVIGVMIEEYKK